MKANGSFSRNSTHWWARNSPEWQRCGLRWNTATCAAAATEHAIPLFRRILRRAFAQPGHRAVGPVARPGHTAHARSRPARCAQREFCADLRGCRGRQALRRPLFSQAGRFPARALRGNRRLPAVDRQPPFRRMQVPAGRHHDRERHVPDRQDGMGGGPDARCVRVGSPQRRQRHCRRCGRRCAGSPGTCRSTALRTATSSRPTSSCRTPRTCG